MNLHTKMDLTTSYAKMSLERAIKERKSALGKIDNIMSMVGL